MTFVDQRIVVVVVRSGGRWRSLLSWCMVVVETTGLFDLLPYIVGKVDVCVWLCFVADSFNEEVR